MNMWAPCLKVTETLEVPMAQHCNECRVLCHACPVTPTATRQEAVSGHTAVPGRTEFVTSSN